MFNNSSYAPTKIYSETVTNTLLGCGYVFSFDNSIFQITLLFFQKKKGVCSSKNSP